MGKTKLAEAAEQYKALQKEAEKLQATAGVTPQQLEEMAGKLTTQSKIIAELEEQERSEKSGQKGKLPSGLFAALKKSIIETAPQVKGKDGKFAADSKFVEAVNALKVDDCEIVTSKGDTHVIHAGKYGVRKVTV